MRNSLLAVAAFAVVLHLAGCDREPAGSPAASARSPPAPGAVDAGAPGKMLQDWGKALEARSFAKARSFFGNAGAASGMSEALFARTWDKYRTIAVTIGTGRVEGAAGSSYYEAPVTVTGLTQEGRPYNLEGTVTARRVNDVPGASPEQLRWHIDSTSLNP
jgi:hypothetical protein